MMKRLALVAAAAAFAFGSAGPSAAGDPNGNFQVKAGITGVIWQDDNKGIFLNGAPVAGADAYAKDVILPTATLTYFFSKNIAAELFCCFAHADVKAAGTLSSTLGQGKVANTWTFPPILTLQYRFNQIGAFKPYVGAGVQWIHYFNSKSNLSGATLGGFQSVDFKDSWGLALQAGFDYDLGGGWSFGFDVKKVFEDTKITWSNGAGSTITTKHDLDPLLLTANIGYRFNLEDLFGRRSSAAPLK